MCHAGERSMLRHYKIEEDTRFGGGVVRVDDDALLGGYRGEVDDAAPAGGAHRGEDALRDQEDGSEIYA